MATSIRDPWVAQVQSLLYHPETERTWAWLARRIGISKAYMSKLVSGERPMTERVRVAICKELKMPEDLIFGTDEGDQPGP